MSFSFSIRQDNFLDAGTFGSQDFSVDSTKPATQRPSECNFTRHVPGVFSLLRCVNESMQRSDHGDTGRGAAALWG
jgi:hypothetical protein